MPYPYHYTSLQAESLEIARLAVHLLLQYATPYQPDEIRAAVRDARSVMAQTQRQLADAGWPEAE